LIAKEGGYVSNPVDPGGETKFGISRKAYPSIDIKSITLEQAKRIYYEDYWRKAKIHRVLNWDVASKLLDIVVNFGENQAKEIIQRSLMSVHRRPRMGLEGKWSRLVELVNGVSNNEALLAALRSEQAAVYRMIVQKKEPLNIFLDGWLIRAYS
jgi:lysozyme family protein